jgi:hypothetical protein
VAKTIEAGRAKILGEDANAVELLREAIAALETLDMSLVASAARMRLGQLIGGDEGTRLVERARKLMTAERIVDPERMCRLFVPGFVA